MIGNWMNYILFLAALAFGYVFYNNYIMFVIIGAAIAVPIVSIIVFEINYKKLQLSIVNLPLKAGKNADIQFGIMTLNRTIFPFGSIRIKLNIKNLFYNNQKEYIINIPDIPRKERKIQWKFSAVYSGCVRINIDEVELTDMLSLVKRTYPVNIEKTIEIYPDECEIDTETDALTAGAGDETEVQYIKGMDVSEVSGIREYISGDSMQAVHWKLSSRYDNFMVKDFSMPYTDRVYLAIELYNNPSVNDEMDNVIDIYYSMARLMVKQGRQFFMLWYNIKTGVNEIMEIQTEEDVVQAVGNMMYSYPSEHPLTAFEAIKNEYPENDYTLIYVTGSMTCINGEKIYTYNDKVDVYLIE